MPLTETADSADLSTVADGELLDLAIPIQTLKRRTLVMWLYLKFRQQMSLDEFDAELTLRAEVELKRRAKFPIGR